MQCDLGLQADDGNRPQSQYKTGLLFEILDDGIERAFYHVWFARCLLGLLLLEDGVRLRPDDRDVRCVHDDYGQEQGE